MVAKLKPSTIVFFVLRLKMYIFCSIDEFFGGFMRATYRVYLVLALTFCGLTGVNGCGSDFDDPASGISANNGLYKQARTHSLASASVGATPFLAVADMNKDGITDVLVTTNSANIGIYRGIGEGAFHPFPELITAGNTVTGFVVKDFNVDQTATVSGQDVIGVANASLEVLHSNASSTATPFNGRYVVDSSNVVTGAVTRIMMRDVNGDSKQDMFTSGAGGINVSLGNSIATGTPLTFTTSLVTATATTDMCFGAFGGGSSNDILAFTGSALAIYWSTVGVYAAATAPTGSATYPTLAGSPQNITCGDFNGDGKTDVAVATRGDGTTTGFTNGAAIYLGTQSAADGYFTRYNPDLMFPVSGGPAQISAEDVTGDGVLDLLVAYQYPATGATYSGIAVLAGLGGTQFTERENYFYASTTAVVNFVRGDVTGDGKLDLVVTHANATTFAVLQAP